MDVDSPKPSSFPNPSAAAFVAGGVVEELQNASISKQNFLAVSLSMGCDEVIHHSITPLLPPTEVY